MDTLRKYIFNHKIIILAVFALFYIGCKSIKDAVPIAIEDDKKPALFKKITAYHWIQWNEKEFIPEAFDTVVIDCDTLGRAVKIRVFRNKLYESGWPYDTLYNKYVGVDSLPNWKSVMLSKDSTKTDTFEGTHVFDEHNKLIREFYIHPDQRWSQRATYAYDSSGRITLHEEFHWPNVISRITNYSYFDSLNLHVKKRIGYQRNGDTIGVFIDTNYVDRKGNIIKTKRWTDWEERSYYQKLPQCHIGILEYQYDDENRKIKTVINSQDPNGTAIINHKYDRLGKLIEKQTVISRDTFIHRIEYAYDKHDKYILKEEFRDGKIDKYVRREITYW